MINNPTLLILILKLTFPRWSVHLWLLPLLEITNIAVCYWAVQETLPNSTPIWHHILLCSYWLEMRLIEV